MDDNLIPLLTLLYESEHKDMHIYRNYVSYCLSCVGSIILLRVLVFLENCMICWFWVACFSRAVLGVAWDLIDMVNDIDDITNWAAIWEFLVDVMEETNEKMRTIKNL